MKLHDLVLKAQGFKFSYIAIDDDSRLFGFNLKPTFNDGMWDNNVYDRLYGDQYLGDYDYPTKDVSKCIININDLTLRNVL